MSGVVAFAAENLSEYQGKPLTAKIAKKYRQGRKVGGVPFQRAVHRVASCGTCFPTVDGLSFSDSVLCAMSLQKNLRLRLAEWLNVWLRL